MRTTHWLAAVVAVAVALPVWATPSSTSYDFAAGPTSGTTYTSFGDAASWNGLYNSTYFGNSATYAGTGGAGLSTTVTAWASTGTYTATNCASNVNCSLTGGTGTASGVNATNTNNGTIQNAVLTAYSVNNGTSAQTQFSGTGYALAETSRNTNGGNGGTSSTTGNHDFTCDSSTCTPDTPQHAVDNSGAYETLLFTFSKAVTLSSVTLGYPAAGSDPSASDATVLYCITNCNTAYFQDKTYSQLVSSGSWGYVNLNDLSSSNDTGLTGLSVTSQYWMIGAYIADLPGNAASDGPDYLKIRGIVTTCVNSTCTSVPEPGSVALFGIAGAGLIYQRRRRFARKL